MSTCDSCKWWFKCGPDSTGFDRGIGGCSHPKLDGPDAVDSLTVETDQPVGILTGPKFGCIHHEN